MSLENSIKDIISKKLEDGTVEKLIGEQLESGIAKALASLLGSYGDGTKIIETQIKSVMVPYLEAYDYSQYIVKLDSVLVDVLKNSALENKKLLTNFKSLVSLEEKKTITVSELFELWKKHVAKEVKTDGLEINEDDRATYENVEVTLDVDYDNDRDWSSFKHATLVFECEHDEEMNFAIRLSRWNEEKEKEWRMLYTTVHDISSLRNLNDFEMLLMKLSQNGTKIIMDTDSDSDEVEIDAEPEASYS